MTSHNRWTTPEDVLAAIREHGPITKSALGVRLCGSSNPRLERILDDLHARKAIKLGKGYQKNGKRQIGWVYSVTQ